MGNEKEAEKPNTNINGHRYLLRNKIREQMSAVDVEANYKERNQSEKEMQTSKEIDSFTCSICSYTCHKRYQLLRHLKTHSKSTALICSLCERSFKTIASLQNHINMHTGHKPHICKDCSSCYATSGQLIRHVRYKHTLERPHRCPECDYTSVERSKLRRHMTCHNGDKPFQCAHCTYTATDKFKLNRHLRTHTGEKPYQCDKCKMRFTQKSSLKIHTDNVHDLTNKVRFACALCPVTCGRKVDLRTHIQKMHTQGQLHVCRLCKRSFPDKYTCKVHTKGHKGEKLYRCELCPYASESHRHLTSHMRTHTGEKPFKCNDCDQRFRQKQLLRRHTNLYHNPNYKPVKSKEKTHVCPHCEGKFAHKGNWIRHMVRHGVDIKRYEQISDAKECGKGKTNKETPREPGIDDDRGQIVTVGGEDYCVVVQVMNADDETEQKKAIANRIRIELEGTTSDWSD